MDQGAGNRPRTLPAPRSHLVFICNVTVRDLKNGLIGRGHITLCSSPGFLGLSPGEQDPQPNPANHRKDYAAQAECVADAELWRLI